VCICSTLFKRKNWHAFHGNFLEIRAGAGGPVCFLRTWQPFFAIGWHSGLFFLSAWTCALVGGGKKTRKRKGKNIKLKQSKKEKNKKKETEGRVRTVQIE
jgi:hypothetical protein